MVPEIPDDVQRWTAKRRVALVVSILNGETSVAEAALSAYHAVSGGSAR